VLVASSPGSAADIVSRIVTQRVPEALGQQVVIDNLAADRVHSRRARALVQGDQSRRHQAGVVSLP